MLGRIRLGCIRATPQYVPKSSTYTYPVKYTFTNPIIKPYVPRPIINVFHTHKRRFTDTPNPPEKPPSPSKETIMNALYSLKNDIKNTTYITELQEVINNVVKEIEHKKYNMMRIKITIGILIFIIILALYDLISSWLSTQVNVITEKSLEDEKMKQKIVLLCKNVVNELSQSKEIQNDITGLLKIAVISLTKDEEIQKQITELLKTSVINLSNDKEIEKNIGLLLKQIVIDLSNNPDVEKNMRELVDRIVDQVSKDQDTHNKVSKLVTGSLYTALFGPSKEKVN